MGGLTSGLNVSLMSISQMKIDLLALSSSPYDQKVVAKLAPIIRDEHLLLVTLLVGNAAAMEALPIFLDELVASWLAVVISVSFVLIFGEIIPQAIFAKDPVGVGYRLAPLVRFLQFIFFPICWPIARLLDRCLQHSHGAVFSKEEMHNLFRIIGGRSDYRETRREFDRDELMFLDGALTLYETLIIAEMIPWDKTVKLSDETILDENGLRDIWQSGFSRIPIFKGKNVNNICGLLLTKDLIVVDPSPTLKVSRFVRRKPLILSPSTNMIAAINLFQAYKTHLALICDDRWVDKARECMGKSGCDMPDDIEWLGIITLEDIMEELIKEEIEDEHDAQTDEEYARLAAAMTSLDSPRPKSKAHVPASVDARVQAKLDTSVRVQRNALERRWLRMKESSADDIGSMMASPTPDGKFKFAGIGSHPGFSGSAYPDYHSTDRLTDSPFAARGVIWPRSEGDMLRGMKLSGLSRARLTSPGALRGDTLTINEQETISPVVHSSAHSLVGSESSLEEFSEPLLSEH
jgi:CBS domain containing-hemolysin-like protein